MAGKEDLLHALDRARKLAKCDLHDFQQLTKEERQQQIQQAFAKIKDTHCAKEIMDIYIGIDEAIDAGSTKSWAKQDKALRRVHGAMSRIFSIEQEQQ